MSQTDRDKWNARYADGAYESRPHPSAFLEQMSHLLPTTGRALDLACGAGRNALFLARRGMAVDAVDISRVALALGQMHAGDLPITWIEHDLDLAPPNASPARRLAPAPTTPGLRQNCRWRAKSDRLLGFEATAEYDVIVNMRYVDTELVISLIDSLRPGGLVVIEQHLETDEPVVGPKNPKFRVAEGTLAQLAQGLEVEHLDEGLVRDPDGRTMALARLVARKR